MNSLIKNVKPEFVIHPLELLETKATVLVDIKDILDSYYDDWDNFFIPVDQGIYRPWDDKPLFTIYEQLYTHKDQYEWFPEIAAPMFRTVNEVLSKQLEGKRITSTKMRDTIGEPITWREAMQNRVNVYNEKGRLLLGSHSDRSQRSLLINPGTSVFGIRFILDLVEYITLETTCWGDKYAVAAEMQKYINPNINIDFLINYAIERNFKFFQEIRQWVQRDPWLIYKCRNFGTTLFLESSCDFRHYQCNELVRSQMVKNETDDLIEQTFMAPERPEAKIDHSDLPRLYKTIFEETGIQVNSITDIEELLEISKSNKMLGERLCDIIYNAKVNSTKTAKTLKSVHKKSINNGTPSFNFNGGVGVYIL